MKIAYLFWTALLLSTGMVMGQRNCGTMEHLQWQMQNDPSISRNMEKQEGEIANWVRDHGSNFRTSGGLIVIPVVVHVVYRTAVQNISTAQIQSQIDVLNEDFGATNADITNVPAAWTNLVGPSGIQFCLASRNPQGFPTTGIDRVQTTVASWTSNDAVKYTAQGGADAWDRNSYLNLWVCNLGSGLLGYAQFPGSGLAATDGVVIGYSCFGRVGTVSAPYNKGRTASHEVGHWLNLYHIWGDDGGSCVGSDQVADTPSSAGEYYGCPSFPHLDACQPAAPGVMFMNYMDYTDDPCMYFFTAGQCVRMNAALAGPRASLVNSQGCVPVVLASNDATVYGITSPSGTYCTGQITPSFSLKSLGADTLTSVMINWQIDAGPVQTQAWTGSLAFLASTVVTLPVQTVANGIHTLTVFTTDPNAGIDGQLGNDSTFTTFTISTSGQALPFAYDFTNSTWPAIGWTVNNPDSSVTWQRHATVGNGGSGAVWVNNFNYNAIGQRDEFILPAMDFSGAAAATMTFDLSYRLYSASGHSDTLIVYGSTDCGVTWMQVYKKFGQPLTTTTPYFQQSPFTPTTAAQWRNDSVNLNILAGNGVAFIKFVGVSEYQNNLYIDNINLSTSSVAIDPATLAAAVSVFPNPTSGVFQVKVNLPAFSDLGMAVYNAVGQKVAARNFASYSSGAMEFDLSGHAQGVYFLRIEVDGNTIVKKIVLQ